MLLLRNVEKSVREKLVELFTVPPSGLTNPYNVYGEDKFMDSAFHPAFPYIWLMTTRVPPRRTRLPMVLIERAPVGHSPYEIGTRAGSFCVFHLHVFAHNRGERGDLAAFLYQNFLTLDLYDFSTDPAALRYSVAIDGRATTPMSVAPDVGEEGALNNWEMVTIDFQLKD